MRETHHVSVPDVTSLTAMTLARIDGAGLQRPLALAEADCLAKFRRQS